jgi:ketopantoate hydroxymethyltransferase
VRAFAEDVRTHRYPAPDHTYSIDPDELTQFRLLLG